MPEYACRPFKWLWLVVLPKTSNVAHDGYVNRLAASLSVSVRLVRYALCNIACGAYKFLVSVCKSFLAAVEAEQATA